MSTERIYWHDVCFVVEGPCKGKMRPRATRMGGFTRVYTPKQEVEYENWVRLCYKKKAEEKGIKGVPFPKGTPVKLTVNVHMKIPKSTSKKTAQLMMAGYILPEKKPDIDNCLKSIADALNGIAYDDDSQIACVEGYKWYDDRDYCKVTVERIDREDAS